MVFCGTESMGWLGYVGMWESKKQFEITLSKNFEQRSQILCRLYLFKLVTEPVSWSELLHGFCPSFPASILWKAEKKFHTWSRKLKDKETRLNNECVQWCYRTKPGHSSTDSSKTWDYSNCTFLGSLIQALALSV